MATVFSEISLYYGADNRLHVVRNFTNSDNTGVGNATLGSQPVLPEGGHGSKFEMRVTPNTGGNIIQNDFANWRSLGAGVGYVRHRVERSDTDPAGSTSASVNLSVAVRRIAYTPDAVSGVVTFNNTITTEGAIEPDPGTGTTFTAHFSGMDNNTGYAELAIQRVGGSLAVRRRLVGRNSAGDDVDTDTVINMFEVTPDDSNIYSCQVINVNVLNAGGGSYNNNAVNYVNAVSTDLFTVNSGIATINEIRVQFTVRFRRNTDSEIIGTRTYIFQCSSVN